MDPFYNPPTVYAEWAPGFTPRSSSFTWVALPRVKSVSIKRGRQEELGTMQPGTCTLVLGGHPTIDDSLDPLVIGSETFTEGLPFTPIRVLADYQGNTYPLFTGYVDGDAFTPVGPPRGQDQPVRVDAVDFMGWASQVDLPDSPYGVVAMANTPIIYLTGELAKETPERAYDDAGLSWTGEATVTFGAGGSTAIEEGDSVIPGSSLPSIEFTSASTTAFVTQNFPIGFLPDTDNFCTVALWIETEPTLADRTILTLRDSGGDTGGVIGINAAGRPYAQMRSNSGTLLATATTTGSILADAANGSVLLVATWNRLTKTVTITIDDPDLVAGTSASAVYGGSASDIMIGGATIRLGSSSIPAAMKVGGVAVYSAIPTDLTGFPADSLAWDAQYRTVRVANLLEAVHVYGQTQVPYLDFQLTAVEGGGSLGAELDALGEAFGGATFMTKDGEISIVSLEDLTGPPFDSVSWAVTDAPDGHVGYATLRSTTRGRTGRRLSRVINWVEILIGTPSTSRAKTVRSRDRNSILRYGRKAYSPPRRAYNRTDVDDIADLLVSAFAEPRVEIDEVTIEPYGDGVATNFALYGAELLYPVRYVETKRGSETERILDDTFRIQSETFDWADGRHWKCTYRLAPDTASTTRSVSLRVLGPGDDAHQDQTGGNYSATATTLDMHSNTSAGSRYVAGIRFQADIPQGAVITSATLNGAIIDAKNDDINVDVYVQNVDNAPAYTSSANGPNTRTTYTGAAVPWVALSSTTVDRVSSPAITAGVQAVVNRAGWAPGNYIGIILRGKSNANYLAQLRSYDHPLTPTPTLEVTYEL